MLLAPGYLMSSWQKQDLKQGLLDFSQYAVPAFGFEGIAWTIVFVYTLLLICVLQKRCIYSLLRALLSGDSGQEMKL